MLNKKGLVLYLNSRWRRSAFLCVSSEVGYNEEHADTFNKSDA